MFSMLIIVKISVTIAIVLALSLIAEHVSPRVAGLLAGYPLGAALALFFYGLEISPEFAAISAIYTILGLIAIQSFAYFYYITSLHVRKFIIPASSVMAVSGYFLVAWLLHFLKLSTLCTTILSILSILLFVYLFRQIENRKIQKRIRLNFQVLCVRAFFAAAFIVVITGIAHLVGPRWAGLLSAFPTTFFPLLLIVHFTYSSEHAHTVIKNFPIGLGSIIAYGLSVSFTYPACGVLVGTGISLGIATVYLLIYNFAVYRGE